MAFGTVFTLDTVAEQKDIIADIDQDRIWENLDAFFRAHNRLFMMVLEHVAERTTDRVRRIGDVAQNRMQELDEYGMPSAQKLRPKGYNIGFPLRRFGEALQWTDDYFENATVEEFTKQVNAITDADEQMLYLHMRRAIYSPTNYTFTDWQQMPEQDVEVKALLNADGLPIPTNPNGVTFDGATHTHYLGVTTGGSPTQGETEGLIETVTEHFNTGEVMVYINRADEAIVEGYTDFKPYSDPRLTNQLEAIIASNSGTRLDVRNIHNRAIGLLDGAEFWVKPWIPQGYFFAFAMGVPQPLVIRQHERTNMQGLRLVDQDDRYPLRARGYDHRWGVAVWTRMNGAVLDIETGSDTYTEPNLN